MLALKPPFLIEEKLLMKYLWWQLNLQKGTKTSIDSVMNGGEDGGDHGDLWQYNPYK